MSGEADAMAAFKRAGARAAYHLLRAGVESLKALEAVIDEVGGLRREDDDTEAPQGRTRIDLE